MITTKRDYTELKAEIRKLDQSYFQESKSLVTDRVYDAGMARLEALEKLHPEWITSDSPAQSLPDDRRPDKFNSRQHRLAMLSLAKVFAVEDLDKWRGKLTTYTENLILEPKIDGLALSVNYENGKLTRAVTRGDGQWGDDVTWQAGGVFGVPRQLATPYPSILEVRGEVFMPKQAFREVNLDRTAAGVELLANPRNAASGALKSLDGAALKERKLRFLPYGVGYTSPDFVIPAHEHLLLTWLNLVGFGLLPMVKILPMSMTTEDLEQIITKANFERQHLEFGTDGVVFKLNNLRFRETLPTATKVAVGAIAYKYAAEEAETRCTGVTFQVGRTGAIAPVAELDPVELDGTTVARASLHNQENIEKLGLQIGDLVSVRKAGEIIPEVVSVVEKNPNGHVIEFPTKCPICSNAIVRRTNADGEESSAWFCGNAECAGQVLGRLEHWCARDAMDIRSVGPETLELFQKHLSVCNVDQLYELTVEQMLKLPGFGLVKADKVFTEIAVSKTKGLARVLAGFGISKFGRTFADKVAREYSDLWQFATSVQVAVNGGAPHALLGPVVARNVAKWLMASAPLLQQLEAVGVSLKSVDYVAPDQRQQKLSGWKVVFTGSLTIDRDKAEQWVIDQGGQVVGSVSGKTTHLVVGAEPGSKLDKAKKLGIKILNEEEFKEAVGKD